jgi:hypothetical protein
MNPPLIQQGIMGTHLKRRGTKHWVLSPALKKKGFCRFQILHIQTSFPFWHDAIQFQPFMARCVLAETTNRSRAIIVHFEGNGNAMRPDPFQVTGGLPLPSPALQEILWSPRVTSYLS